MGLEIKLRFRLMVGARGLIICPDLKTWLQERPSEFSRLFCTFRRLVTGPRLSTPQNVSQVPDYFAFSRSENEV